MLPRAVDPQLDQLQPGIPGQWREQLSSPARLGLCLEFVVALPVSRKPVENTASAGCATARLCRSFGTLQALRSAGVTAGLGMLERNHGRKCGKLPMLAGMIFHRFPGVLTCYHFKITSHRQDRAD